MPKQRRKATRTQLWFDSEAIVKFEYGKIKGKVDNVSAKGMFIETSQHIPEYSEVEIKIIFKSKTPSEISGIKGTVIWSRDKGGMGILFKEIDLDRFRECMAAIMVN
ncbi:MAG: PilZ domain-containing protein [Proteobacteria bacterium]|nr:PilZ domain-containing protein [Pseudomonadota bacterium]